MTVKDFFVSAFSEPNSTSISWGRLASTLTLISSICWVTFLLIKNHAMPDLTGPTSFGLAPYGTNKILTKAGEIWGPAPRDRDDRDQHDQR